MYDRLQYRRQFLLANSTIEELKEWQYQSIGDVHLYAHPDLEVSVGESNTRQIIILGYIFDPMYPDKSNKDIIFDISLKAINFNDIIRLIKPCAGRYALIYKDEDCFNVLHDPLGLREIYYCTHANRVICGSQPNLLDIFSFQKLGITKDEKIINFYKNDMKSVRSARLWVGDETYYRYIKHLMPNHYLDLNTLKVTRYWPNRKLERITMDEAVQHSCSYLKGVMTAATKRFKVMMAVTSGMDSRSLLAASKDVRSNIYYFINKHPHLKDTHPDIDIPKNMFSFLDIPFHVHDVTNAVDEEFKKMFLNNVFLSSELLLPAIYNVYYKFHQDKVNLLGVGEIGRDYYGNAPLDIDGYYLAHCLKFKRSVYATEQCDNWLKEVKEIAQSFNIDIMKLLLWECLLGNWGCVGNSESDIAIEEFDPYDSHYIYEIMLSVSPAQGDLFKGMFMEMWPELLAHPFNPPVTKMEELKSRMEKKGIYQFLKRVAFKYDRWKFYRLRSAKF